MSDRQYDLLSLAAAITSQIVFFGIAFALFCSISIIFTPSPEVLVAVQ